MRQNNCPGDCQSCPIIFCGGATIARRCPDDNPDPKPRCLNAPGICGANNRQSMKPNVLKPISGFENYSISPIGEIWSDFGGGRLLNPKPNATGYLSVSLSGPRGQRTFAVHRLVWDSYGSEPHQGGSHRHIHHMDGDPTNNDIANLDYVAAAVNARDTKLNKTNTSGFRGVSQQPGSKRWRALTRIDGIQKSLGTFDTPEEASAAYEDKFNELIDAAEAKSKESQGVINYNYFYIYN